MINIFCQPGLQQKLTKSRPVNGQSDHSRLWLDLRAVLFRIFGRVNAANLTSLIQY